MEFDDIYNRAVTEVKLAGIWKSNAFPPIHRAARNFGFESRPPHYNSFTRNAIVTGAYLTVAWGIVYSVLDVSSGQDISVARIIVSSLLFGLFFGLCMASYYKFSASSNSLSQWDALSRDALSNDSHSNNEAKN